MSSTFKPSSFLYKAFVIFFRLGLILFSYPTIFVFDFTHYCFVVRLYSKHCDWGADASPAVFLRVVSQASRWRDYGYSRGNLGEPMRLRGGSVLFLFSLLFRYCAVSPPSFNRSELCLGHCAVWSALCITARLRPYRRVIFQDCEHRCVLWPAIISYRVTIFFCFFCTRSLPACALMNWSALFLFHLLGGQKIVPSSTSREKLFLFLRSDVLY